MHQEKNNFGKAGHMAGTAQARTGIHLSVPIGQSLRIRQKDRGPLPSRRQYYEVQVGDSLSKIAKEHYGEVAKWKIIYEANKRLIKNPDEIHPGQVIELPDGRTPDGKSALLRIQTGNSVPG